MIHKKVVLQFIQIPDSVKRTQLLQNDLPKGWKIPSPQAIISITGVSHQFNLKDKRHLKRHLIDAVISTGKTFTHSFYHNTYLPYCVFSLNAICLAKKKNR